LPLFFVVVLALRQQGCVHPPRKSPKYLGVRSVIFERENLACDKAKRQRKALCLSSGFNAAAGQIRHSKTYCTLLIEGTIVYTLNCLFSINYIVINVIKQ
jgi:hypothetical protein